MGKDGFNLEERVLCSDDNCIGLVGADGRCKVCGLSYTGDETVCVTDGITNGSSGEQVEPPDGLPEEPTEEVDSMLESSDDDERVCCSDEMCIGIIGENGKCGTCGKYL